MVFINANLSDAQLQKLLPSTESDEDAIAALKRILLDPECPYFSNYEELEGYLERKRFDASLLARDLILYSL